MQFIHQPKWQQQQRAQGQQRVPQSEHFLPSGRLTINGQPTTLDEQRLAQNLSLGLPMVWVQVAVTEGLHAVVLYPIEPMQTIIATCILAWEQHDVTTLQRLFLNRH